MLVKLTGDSINRRLNKQTIILGGNREPDSLRLLVLDMSRAGSSFRLDPDEPVPSRLNPFHAQSSCLVHQGCRRGEKVLWRRCGARHSPKP